MELFFSLHVQQRATIPVASSFDQMLFLISGLIDYSMLSIKSKKAENALSRIHLETDNLLLCEYAVFFSFPV